MSFTRAIAIQRTLNGAIPPPGNLSRRFSTVLNKRLRPVLFNEATTLRPSRIIEIPTSSYASSGNGFFLTGIKKLLGLGKMSKTICRVTGYKLYESIGTQVNVQQFFIELNLPDTFHSWFVITELHVWMLMVRLMAEGDAGRQIRNAVVEAMWQDVEFKSKELGDVAASVRRKQIETLVSEFQASLFSYDEGLLSSDKVLAGALWRNFYGQETFDIRHLDFLVHYVRANIANLDQTTAHDLISERKVQWQKLQL